MSARQLFQGLLLRSPHDFQKLPGYIDDFDPRLDPIESIEYHYAFDVMFRCSNVHCHQQHGDGFLVRLKSNLLTNIGWVCASKADAGFDHKVNQFFQERQIPWLRAQIATLKRALPQYDQEINELQDHARDLIKMKHALRMRFPQVFRLLTTSPGSDVFKVTEVVHEKRVETDRFGDQVERNVAREKVVAEVDTRFLRESLGTLITDVLRPAVTNLAEANPGTMTYSQLTKCLSKAEIIDSALEQAVRLRAAGERLFSVGTEFAIKSITSVGELGAEIERFSLKALEETSPSNSTTPAASFGSIPLTRRDRRRHR